VKAFIREDVPKYSSSEVEFKPIPGHAPDLVLLDDSDKELERIDLSELNREQCNELLAKRGFHQKEVATNIEEGREL